MEKFDVVWRPDPERAASTNTARFMAEHGLSDLEELGVRSVEDPEWFWREVIRFLGLPFDREPTVIRDTSRGVEWTTWFVDEIGRASCRERVWIAGGGEAGT